MCPLEAAVVRGVVGEHDVVEDVRDVQRAILCEGVCDLGEGESRHLASPDGRPASAVEGRQHSVGAAVPAIGLVEDEIAGAPGESSPEVSGLRCRPADDRIHRTRGHRRVSCPPCIGVGDRPGRGRQRRRAQIALVDGPRQRGGVECRGLGGVRGRERELQPQARELGRLDAGDRVDRESREIHDRTLETCLVARKAGIRVHEVTLVQHLNLERGTGRGLRRQRDVLPLRDARRDDAGGDRFTRRVVGRGEAAARVGELQLAVGRIDVDPALRCQAAGVSIVVGPRARDLIVDRSGNRQTAGQQREHGEQAHGYPRARCMPVDGVLG